MTQFLGLRQHLGRETALDIKLLVETDEMCSVLILAVESAIDSVVRAVGHHYVVAGFNNRGLCAIASRAVNTIINMNTMLFFIMQRYKKYVIIYTFWPISFVFFNGNVYLCRRKTRKIR